MVEQHRGHGDTHTAPPSAASVVAPQERGWFEELLRDDRRPGVFLDAVRTGAPAHLRGWLAIGDTTAVTHRGGVVLNVDVRDDVSLTCSVVIATLELHWQHGVLSGVWGHDTLAATAPGGQPHELGWCGGTDAEAAAVALGWIRTQLGRVVLRCDWDTPRPTGGPGATPSGGEVGGGVDVLAHRWVVVDTGHVLDERGSPPEASAPDRVVALVRDRHRHQDHR